MIIKDYKCKCGHDDFFFADKGGQKGIYCSYCGKWFKWADKDEQNLRMKPYEPKTGHWIIIDDCEKFIAKCSECGRIEDSRMISKYPYCHCGARMVEPQESEETDG